MSKKVLTSFQLLSNQDLSSSFYSPSTNVQYYDRICYSLSWSGSAVGRITVQGSIDNVKFDDLDMNPIIMNNATDTGVFDIQQTALPYLRLSYISTSGGGPLNAFVSGKES